MIVVPTLILIVLVIAEFGMLFSDVMILQQGAREGGRQVAIGSTLETARARVRQASYSGVADNYIVAEAYNSLTSTWVAVADSADGTSNTATPGWLVRLRINRYPHRMVTGRFFSWLPGYSSGTLPMSAQMIMRRE